MDEDFSSDWAENWAVRTEVVQEGDYPLLGVSTYLDLVVVSVVFVTSRPGDIGWEFNFLDRARLELDVGSAGMLLWSKFVEERLPATWSHPGRQ